MSDIARRCAAVLGLAASLACLCRFAVAATPPVLPWAARVLADDQQPQWKHDLASRAAAGACAKFTAKTTAYSDKDYLDPHTGGGIWGCSWIDPCGRHRH